MRRRSLYLFLAGALLLVALTPLVIPSREPRYQGRTLTSWLLQARTNQDLPDLLLVESAGPSTLGTPTTRQAIQAIRQIGPRAVPELLDWIKRPNPLMQEELHALHHLLPATPVQTQRIYNRADLAVLGFYVLGPRATTAVPELTSLMRDRAVSQQTREAAMAALAHLGPAGLNPLLNAFADPSQPTRRLAAYYIGSMQYLGTNASPAVPVLVNLLKDQEEQIATRAATALGDLAIEPSLTIPALTNALRDPRPFVRASAASALAHLGEQARPAIPALTEALSDPKLQVRAAATNALLLISTQR
jgi:hypothetical protein